ncbi:MAG TPA: ThuA domain-containing protein [Candidatus Ruania gallistercoris]|uniref:ThuA domain-containing protein n=1 Tax=Candidatus Ruania gallistercoris TaxID=2838746 RepID=A0A9D2EDR6_9MICO|nr:ThuA domain-containing protein [Candidatus Ruania gallistercoris]
MIRVLVWNENWHETTQTHVAELYPDGIHGTIAAGLTELLGDQVQVRTATLDEPEHGLTEEALADTEVLLWWGHVRHGDVADAVVERVHQHVLGGLGLIALHSGHYSKIFRALMGTTCGLSWRNEGEREIVWTIDPTHPIAVGIEQPFVIEAQEMYGEHFDVPPPEELVFASWFAGGEVFRSGMTFRRGRGKVFYFSPGDQEYPVYHHTQVRQVLANAVRWARPVPGERRAREAPNQPRSWA